MLTQSCRRSPGFNSMKRIVGVAQLLCGLVSLVALGGCAIPLLNAAAGGDVEKISLLLRQGHHANEALPIIGTRPLTLAAAYGHADVVRVLLEAGAEVNAKDFTGWTALHAGSFAGDMETVSLLLERGAVSGSDKWFLRNPLKIAETLDHKNVIPLLRRSEESLVGQAGPSLKEKEIEVQVEGTGGLAPDLQLLAHL